jgi:hypothetical protein
VAVRIEAEATSEAGVADELILGNTFDQLDEPPVNLVLLPEHLTQR